MTLTQTVFTDHAHPCTRAGSGSPSAFRPRLRTVLQWWAFAFTPEQSPDHGERLGGRREVEYSVRTPAGILKACFWIAAAVAAGLLIGGLH